MVTEEALPTYMSMINGLDGVRDESGCDDTPWATWTRAWTAEEKRHGEALGRYLWMTGRVNGKSARARPRVPARRRSWGNVQRPPPVARPSLTRSLCRCRCLLQVDITVQKLISAGMAPGTENKCVRARCTFAWHQMR